MPAKKNFKTTKTTKSEKKIIKKTENKIENQEKSGLQKTVILQKNIKLRDEDKMLEKIEKYVDRNREKTSQEMIERKSKRPNKKYEEWELELMISRVKVESGPKESTQKISKWIIYLIYIIMVILIIIFCIKYFFVWNVPQIS